MAQNNLTAEKLADFIEANPNCKFEIDNDVWYISKSDEQSNGDDSDQLTTSNDYEWNTNWYSHSCNYGAGLAEALVILLNRRGFNIEAAAV